MPEIKNGLGPDHIVREGDTVIKNGIGPDHIVESIDCGGFQYPPDLTGVDGHVVVSGVPLTWLMLPTNDADNGSLRVIDDSHPVLKVYEFDANWYNGYGWKLSWLLDVLQFRNNQIKNGYYAFRGFRGSKITAFSTLETSNLTNMYAMFQGEDGMATDFNQDLSGWDTSKVVGMEAMFYMQKSFDQDLSGWCVSQMASKPTSFDKGAGFEAQTAKHPQWGQPC